MESRVSDLLGTQEFSPLEGSSLLEVSAGEISLRHNQNRIIVLVDRDGTLPDVDPGPCDVMITIAPEAPSPWVSVRAERLDAQLVAIRQITGACPIAASILARLVKLNESMEFEAALDVESLAYSTLLGGSEFARWARQSPRQGSGEQALPPVRYDRDGNKVTLTLCSPGNRNAMTSVMRDALFEALVNCLEDPSEPLVILRAEGRCFSTGGELTEFGNAHDLAQAHIIRTERSCSRVLHLLGDRVSVCLQGACVGSGIEVPASAARRIGASNTFMQLPELKMGLIPGAGGTVSVARAIGRHRLMWLCLGAFRINSTQALDWGLLHEIEA